jgi:hypothetical protein
VRRVPLVDRPQRIHAGGDTRPMSAGSTELIRERERE